MHSLVVHFNRGCDKEERRISQQQNHPMWLSDNGKQKYKCAERQHFESTSQKGPSGYFTVAKKDSVSCADVLNL